MSKKFKLPRKIKELVKKYRQTNEDICDLREAMDDIEDKVLDLLWGHEGNPSVLLQTGTLEDINKVIDEIDSYELRLSLREEAWIVYQSLHSQKT